VIDASIKMALKLFDAKRMFQAVLDANPQYICWKDRSSTFMGCNRNHAALFGLPDTESIIGKTDWGLHSGEEAIRGFIKDDVEVMESGIARYNIKEKAYYPDGSERLLETNKVPLRDARGDVNGIMIAYSDVTERVKGDERVRALIEEKDLILRELRHRTKNDLAMIAALLSLQASKVASEEARSVLEETGDGIRSMGLLYDKMAEIQGLHEVSVRIYLSDFASGAMGKLPRSGSLRIEVEAEDFRIPTKVLRPLGVMLNEMITNALKYAFVGRDAGRIIIAASAREGLARFSVRDDGVGLPVSVDFDSSTSFGFTLIRTLAAQLEGRASVERGAGMTISVEFPL
jgi:PAS domain S-box-containing protein